MKIAIAGAHGQIAQILTEQLVSAGHSVTGLVRNPDHLAEIEALGATAVLADLESTAADVIADAIDGAQAAVFAAGAGPGSGPQRKLTMDRDGAIKLLAAATIADVPRFVIVSSVGAEDPPEDDEEFSVYLRAKAAADEAVRNSDRNWTIVRPGRLTDGPGTGAARIDTDPFRGEVRRADVASVLVAVLAEPRADGATLYVNGGTVLIADALAAALGG